jgi:hypothetical protein
MRKEPEKNKTKTNLEKLPGILIVQKTPRAGLVSVIALPIPKELVCLPKGMAEMVESLLSKALSSTSCTTPPPQKKNRKRGGRVAQVVEHMSSKCKALTSNPVTTKPKTKKLRIGLLNNINRLTH